MNEVTEEEFKNYFSNKWYTTHKGFFNNSRRYTIDGHYVGLKEEDLKKYMLNYEIIKRHKL